VEANIRRGPKTADEHLAVAHRNGWRVAKPVPASAAGDDIVAQEALVCKIYNVNTVLLRGLTGRT